MSRKGRIAAFLAAGLAVIAVVVLVVATVDRVDEGAPPPAMAGPTFVEVARAAGIDHVYDGGSGFSVGGGVAVFDCDGDGFPDLYFAGGAHAAALYRNRSTFRGEPVFGHVPSAATDLTAVTGAYPLDVDGDGVTDLAVLRNGENVMLRGLGGCRFARANETWGIDGDDGWTTAFSATWERGAALPTLAFGDYATTDGAGRQQNGCAAGSVHRPVDGAYMVTSLAPGWCSLSMLFSDWDRSGGADLRVSNHRRYSRDGEEQLWRFEPSEPPELYGRATGWAQLQISGAGIATHDLTGDGYPEVLLTGVGDNKLQTLEDGADQPTYRDIAAELGVTEARRDTGNSSLPSPAWHGEFADVNNDGFIDLYVSKGSLDAAAAAEGDDPNNLFLGQEGGGFEEIALAAGILNAARGRGAALVDLNLDGMVDLVEVNLGEPITVWRNVGWGEDGDPAPMGNWVSVRLVEAAPNPDAIGAWIEVRSGDRVLMREVTVGGGHAGGQLGWIHFGVGDADDVEIRVTWPGPDKGDWMPTASNRFVVARRSAGSLTAWEPELGER